MPVLPASKLQSRFKSFPPEQPPALLQVPDVPQAASWDCGAAVVMSVCRFYQVGPEDILDYHGPLGTTPGQGTPPPNIVAYLTSLGLEVEERHGMSLADLQECWKQGLPVLTPIQDYGTPKGKRELESGHWVVVIGAGLGHVFIQDPSEDYVLDDHGSEAAPGRVVIEENDFREAWADRDADGNTFVRYGIIVGPPRVAADLLRPQVKGWVTMGGKPCGEGEHCGGTPVKLSASGEIEKGPQGTVGNKPEDLPKKKGARPKAPKVKPSNLKGEAEDKKGEGAPAGAEGKVKDWKKNGVKSRAFKDWFGDWEKGPKGASKIVDPKTGEPRKTRPKPLTVYHGTRADFDRFDPEKIGTAWDPGDWGAGFYFTPVKRMAEMYAAGQEGRPGGKVLEMYLNVRNPLVFNSSEFAEEKEFQDMLAREYGRGRVDEWVRKEHGMIDVIKREIGPKEFTEFLKRQGYDGVVKNQDGEMSQVIAFEPGQIKATNNEGTFDPFAAEFRKHHPAVREITESLLIRTKGYSPTELQRAEKVDLVTLPEGVSGTNCWNCQYQSKGFCTHPEVRLQVTPRQCCAEWDSPGTYRAWIEEQQKALSSLSDNIGGALVAPPKQRGEKMARKPKKPAEPAWQRAARIDAWKKQQYGWVVYTPGPEPTGYVVQVNHAFAIIAETTPNKHAARKYQFEDAYELLKNFERHNRQGHIEYVGPPHPDEKSLDSPAQNKGVSLTGKSLSPPRVKALPSLVKAGFTGSKRDSLGRTHCYRDGVNVPCGTAHEAPQPRQPKQPKQPGPQRTVNEPGTPPVPADKAAKVQALLDEYARSSTHAAQVRLFPDGTTGLVVWDRATGRVDDKLSRKIAEAGKGPAPGKAPPPPDQGQTLAKIRRAARDRELNDPMQELQGVNLKLKDRVPDAVGRQFDAHGTATLDSLAQLLNGGVDPSREFYSSPLSAAYAEAGGYGTAVKGNSSFVVLGHPGKTIKEGGIGGVLVDDLHAPDMADLQRAFPNVKFIAARDAAGLLPRVGPPGGPAVSYGGKALGGYRVKAGFTGKKQDARGHTHCYRDGVNVPCSQLSGAGETGGGGQGEQQGGWRGLGAGQAQQPPGEKPANFAPPPEGEELKNPGCQDCIHDVDPHLDLNGDGVADAARVGVPAMEVPPPPQEVPRLPNLTGKEREVEDRFASMYLKDPDGLAKLYREKLASREVGDAPHIFGTDDCKALSPDWTPKEGGEEAVKYNRGAYNAVLHQTANALAKRAFLQHLDEVVSQLPDEKKVVLVTSGGVAAGKGYALKNIPETSNMLDSVGAVWDAAGEQNATENPWIAQECEKRGIKMVFAYIHADPIQTWENPQRGVVERAGKIGRMVDARAFSDSYAMGSRNFKAFMDAHLEDADKEFFVLNNATGGKPARAYEMPPEALSVQSEELYSRAYNTLAERKDTLKPGVVRGGTIGGRIWGKPREASNAT